ncbi:MAG: T9SS type A sorting domain-containing protein [Cyclobacteriaceae bacterium]|nr:T9SS type A sorting domain-containing protein [Cyclobacteriaceae bacterium]
MKKLSVTVLFFLFLNIVSAQIFSAQNGNWFNAATWVGGVIPTENDDVVIRHTVSLTDVNPIRLAQARSIIVSNLLDATALLDLSNDAQLEIGNGGLQLNGLNIFNRGVRVRTQNNSLLTIDGDVTVVNNIEGVNTCRLSLIGDSEIVINGDFNYTYSPADAIADTGSEISLANTSRLTINGSVSLTYDSETKGSLLSFLVDNDAEVMITDNVLLNVERTTETVNDGIRFSLGANTTDSNASVNIEGTLELRTLAFNSPATDNEKNVVTVTDFTTLVIEDNLIFKYEGVNQIQDINRFQILSDGMTLINGDIVFIDNNFSTNNNLYLSTRGILELKGNVINTTQGYLQTNIDAAITTVIFSGNTSQQIPPITGRYENLTINNTSGVPLTLGGVINVSRVLTMQNGIVNTGGVNNFIMTTTATANEGNPQSFITGGLVKLGVTNSFFPIGRDQKWAPVFINTNGSGNGNTRFEIDYFNTAHSVLSTNVTLHHVSGAEYWQIQVVPNPPNAVPVFPANVTLTFFYKDACWSDITNTNTIPAQDLLMARLPVGQTEWSAVVTTINANSDPCGVGTEQGSLTVNLTNAVSQYGHFTFASVNGNGNPLPVTWLDFYVIENQNDIELRWSTATEINSNYFEIQKSLDGSHWYEIGRIQGKGNTNQQQNYSYQDQSSKQISYYRIKQFDVNGAYDYSKVIKFELDNFQSYLKIYPNPWHKQTQSLHIETETITTIELYNVSGDLVLSLDSKKNTFTADDINLPQGVYILKLFDNQNHKTITDRLIIQ